ncbi:MAG: hypothetical protein ACJZ76_00280 [Candidatus Pelagibacter sp.]
MKNLKMSKISLKNILKKTFKSIKLRKKQQKPVIKAKKVTKPKNQSLTKY